jgi:hypothetical protein
MPRETKRTLNAFKYPEATEACYPQLELSKPLDFRSEVLPTSGYATIGNRRKIGQGDLSSKRLVAIDMGGSVRGQFETMDDAATVEHSTMGVAAAIPIRNDFLPKMVAFAPRRNRNQKKAQRSSAK